ncbi:MAG: DUF4080 domain-containing protein [Ruminococcaceae bacterium]|nr:DUF4080 domain-containing protein [Oscillospiraceae bacterium]
MKVSVISLNAKYVHLAPAPYALGAGALAFATHPHEICVTDGVAGKDEEAALDRALSVSPDLVAFCTYIWNVSSVKRLLPRVRTLLPRAKILLGGPEVSYAVEKTFREMPECDYILSGEGEEPFARLLDALEEKGNAIGVAGCAYRIGDGVFVPTPFIAEGTPPSPIDFGYDKALHGRIAYMESSRGCPFSCAFCLSGRCGSVRFFDLDRVKRDILSLANAQTETVKFVDRTFNADRARAKEIWRFIIEKRASGEIPSGVCFHFEIAGELLDEEGLSLLENAPRGLFQVEIGLQSLHAPTLTAISRKPVSEHLLHAVRRLAESGNIHVHTDLIAGLPKEDLATFRAGFDRAFSLGAHMLQLGFLKLLYGAPMQEEAERFPCTYESVPPYTVTSTPWLSETDLADIALCEEGCERLYNSGKYKKTLTETLMSGASPYLLLRDAGKALATLVKPYTLDDEIALLLSFFGKYLSGERARDLLLLDFIAVNPSCYTPKALRREDSALARVKRTLNERYPVKNGVRRAYAILYTEGCVAFADYDEKDPVTGCYEVKKVGM